MGALARERIWRLAGLFLFVLAEGRFFKRKIKSEKNRNASFLISMQSKVSGAKQLGTLFGRRLKPGLYKSK